MTKQTSTGSPAAAPTPAHHTLAAKPGRRGPYRKTAGRQQEILDAALTVFGRSGYRSGSIREIAETVGISQAGILHHFENKDALLIAVLRHRDDLARGFYSLPLGITTLISTLRVVEFNVAHPGAVELYCVLSAEATARNHPAHEYFVRRYAFLESVIGGALGQMQAAGQLRDGVEPMAAARSALALLDGLQLQWLLNRDSVDMVAAAETYFRQLATEDAWEAAIAAERDQRQSTSVVAK